MCTCRKRDVGERVAFDFAATWVCGRVATPMLNHIYM
jgi:hypothetical protein